MALIMIEGIGLCHTSIFDPPRLQPKPWGDTLEKYFMQDVMIDLETGGTVAGCAIFSIGAVYFDTKTGMLGREMYAISDSKAVDVESGVPWEDQYGLHYSRSTMSWWADQSEEARAIFTHADRMPLDQLLQETHRFILGGPVRNVRVWGNGADFDSPIVAAACRKLGVALPWAPFNSRCYRTIKNLAPNIKIVRDKGVHHNALADAKNQAVHLAAVVQKLGIVLG